MNEAATRKRLRGLAALIRRGGRELVETEIGPCLDAAVAAPPADRWLACEATAWAIAWIARGRLPTGSAGRHRERLIDEAAAARALLADGDTLPARFALVLARLFEDVEPCGRLLPEASAAVTAEIERLASVRGVPNVAGSDAMVDRVVRWTAFREAASALGGAPWAAATEARWREAALVALRLLGDEGRRIESAGLMPRRRTSMLLAAVRGLKRRPARTVEALQAGRSSKAGAKRLVARDLHDADAAVAVMRSDWTGAGLRMLIDYRQAVPRLEVAVGDRMLVDGFWEWSLTVDGSPVEAEGPWTAQGWESDRQASFLELHAPLPGGRQLERQIVMLAEERVVILADAVTLPGRPPVAGQGATNGRAAAIPHLRYGSVVPLAAGLAAEAAGETRELVLRDARPRALALPLALPEWRVGSGGFESTAAGLSLAIESPAPRLYAPLWLDCDPARIGRPLTWRRLTVADSRINLPAWQAVGFRVQAGREQWLVYRSLDAARNRSLLGCNVSCDFLLGRIGPRGGVKRALEIQ